VKTGNYCFSLSEQVLSRKFSGIQKNRIFSKNPVFLKTLHRKIYADLFITICHYCKLRFLEPARIQKIFSWVFPLYSGKKHAK